MPHTISVAREHLQRAATMLEGQDNQSRQLRYIIERTISLMDDLQADLGPAPVPPDNVYDFAVFRAEQIRRLNQA